MTTTSTESGSATLEIPKGHHRAPVHSPNEFHINPETGGLESGLLFTQHPANVKPVSPEELKALEAREQAVAEAESRAQQLIENARGIIAQERAALDADRAQFERDKAGIKEQRSPDQATAEEKASRAGTLPEKDERKRTGKKK